MSDQFERIAATLLAAINRVNTSIQKTSVYISQNSYALNATSVSEVTGTSGAIGGIEIDVPMVGVAGATTTLAALLSVATKLIGSSVDAVTTIKGVLDIQPGLVGSAGGTSGADALMKWAYTLLAGSAGGASGAEGDIRGVTPLLAGSAGGLSAEAASLSVTTQLAGASAATSGCGGMLEGIA